MDVYKGVDGTATLDGDTLTLDFKKRLHASKGAAQVVIPINTITHVDYNKATLAARESIRIRTTILDHSHQDINDPGTMYMSASNKTEPLAEKLRQLSSASEGAKTSLKAEHQEARQQNPQATFGPYKVEARKLTHRLTQEKWSLQGAHADVSVGTPKKGVTLTRAVALGIFSLAAKKDKTKLFITVYTPDGPVIIDGPAKEEKAARMFAAAINSH